jgi:predicted nucleic acid-binding protein
VVDEVFPVTLADTQRARDILLAGADLISARDAIHVSIMERERVTRIMTFDTGFDHAGHIQRVQV